MASIAESLGRAEAILASSGIAEPRREAISLLIASIRRDKAFVYAHPEYDLTSDELVAFDSSLSRRANREPLQYIVGVQEFYGLEFEVTHDVLIPRPETELLVERALTILQVSPTISFCEVGIGSGCISISILYHAKQARGTGVDVSSEAIQVAERNAAMHAVTDRLTVIRSNVFDALGDVRFGLIVTNPPYIPLSQMSSLQPEVRDFEPRSALTDEGDGLSIIRRIVVGAADRLTPGCFLLMEIGFDQSEEVASLFESRMWRTPELIPDLQGIRRVVSAQLK